MKQWFSIWLNVTLTDSSLLVFGYSGKKSLTMEPHVPGFSSRTKAESQAAGEMPANEMASPTWTVSFLPVEHRFPLILVITP